MVVANTKVADYPVWSHQGQSAENNRKCSIEREQAVKLLSWICHRITSPLFFVDVNEFLSTRSTR
jgi:hypothetical protein